MAEKVISIHVSRRLRFLRVLPTVVRRTQEETQNVAPRTATTRLPGCPASEIDGVKHTSRVPRVPRGGDSPPGLVVSWLNLRAAPPTLSYHVIPLLSLSIGRLLPLASLSWVEETTRPSVAVSIEGSRQGAAMPLDQGIGEPHLGKFGGMERGDEAYASPLRLQVLQRRQEHTPHRPCPLESVDAPVLLVHVHEDYLPLRPAGSIGGVFGGLTL